MVNINSTNIWPQFVIVPFPAMIVSFQILGQYVGLNLFKPTTGVCHFDEIFLMFKQHMLPLEGVFSEQVWNQF